MKKLFFLWVLLSFMMTLTGCATTLVYPKDKGQFEVVAYRSQESAALKAALKKAESICSKRDQKLVVLDRSVTYHGVLTREGKKIADQLSNAVFMASGANVPSGSTPEDYKATLLVECRS